MRRDLGKKLVVTALGLGCLPVAPGTWGSAGAVCVYLALRWALPGSWHVTVLSAGVLACLWAGVELCPWAEWRWRSKDPGAFVLDEVAGQWVACMFLWAFDPWAAAAVGFVAFRLFDIAKPPPIRRLEKLRAGYGVMVDDLAAGLYAGLAAWAVLGWVVPMVTA